jgi:hypothetical protein
MVVLPCALRNHYRVVIFDLVEDHASGLFPALPDAEILRAVGLQPLLVGSDVEYRMCGCKRSGALPAPPRTREVVGRTDQSPRSFQMPVTRG